MPTDAITEPYRVDARKCISYLTIELKEKISPDKEEMIEDWIFGCDICQDVCPWNRKAAYGQFDDLRPREHLLHYPKPWSSITEDEFHAVVEGSALGSASYAVLPPECRNVEEFMLKGRVVAAQVSTRSPLV